MRHLEPRLVDRVVSVEQEVEVERPRTSRRAVAGSSERRLRLEQHVQQRPRRERRLERDRAVQKARLIRDKADRIRFAQRRHGDYLDLRIRGERLHRGA